MANARRSYENFVSGTILDAPLAFDATTFESAELAALSDVDSSEHAAIVLDPFGEANGPEIAWVTDHDAAATTATILRGQEGTTAVEHPMDTRWALSPTAYDFILKVATFSDLPSTPFVGQECWIMDTNRLVVWNGTAWQDVYADTAWTSWTPVIGGEWTLGSGSVFGRYRRVAGRLIEARFKFTVGNGVKQGALVGLAIGGLPVACAAGSDAVSADCIVQDVSTGTKRPVMISLPEGTTTMFLNSWFVFTVDGSGYNTLAKFDGVTPFTFSPGDTFDGCIRYEPAS